MPHQWNPDNIWDEHPAFLIEDWQTEIADGDTRLGYIEWVNSQIDQLDEHGAEVVDLILQLADMNQTLDLSKDSALWAAIEQLRILLGYIE